MISASALRANCAYAKVLGAKKLRTPDQLRAMARGTQFHSAVEAWLKTGVPPELADMEMQGWLDLMVATWNPPPDGVHVETAWGLRLDGTYVEVTEPEPHMYAAVDGSVLLTAGRADLDWLDRFDAWTLTNVDLKTGKWPVETATRNLQVNAGAIALSQLRGARGYVPAVYYVRDGAFDFGDYVARESDAWNAMFDDVRAAATLPPQPMPGEWCGGCWERKACPAATAG